MSPDSNDFVQNRSPRLSTILWGAILIGVVFTAIWLWPLRSVPTGSRGVVTVGGAIKGIESEGFMLLAPWQRLDLFNIRAEEATVENTDGSTSDTQPVKVSLTVRYSIQPDKVSEVFEKYSHDGNLQSYVQTATQEVVKAVTAKYTAPDLISKHSLQRHQVAL
jgi:prohibitin 2